MTDIRENPAGCPGEQARYLITMLFRAVLAVSAALALMILLIPGPDFLALSNYFQVVAAIAGSTVFLYCWSRCGHHEAYLWAASGLGLWGIANIGWYASVLQGQRALVFPGLIDFCMIGSFFLLAVAFRKGFPTTEDTTPLLRKAVMAVCVIMAFGVVLIPGTTFPLETAPMATMLYFLACGIFLEECIRYPGIRHAELFTGSVLLAVAFMVYPLREMFFIQSPFSNIIGTTVSAGFALIVMGWLKAVTAGQR